MDGLDKIFELFKPEDTEKSKQLILDYSKYPPYWILMFKKLVMNHLSSYSLILEQSKLIRPDLKDKEIERRIEKAYYPYAFNFLKEIDLKNKEHIDYLKDYSDSQFVKALKATIEYFENIEDYEKCAHLKSICDEVLDNLAKSHM